jgi:hypothetical protein
MLRAIKDQSISHHLIIIISSRIKSKVKNVPSVILSTHRVSISRPEMAVRMDTLFCFCLFVFFDLVGVMRRVCSKSNNSMEQMLECW